MLGPVAAAPRRLQSGSSRRPATPAGPPGDRSEGPMASNSSSRNSRSTPPYEDPRFLESAAARPLRILAEYLSPLDAFRRERVHDTVVFFGSARIAADG